MTEEESTVLDELLEADDHEAPAKTAQLYRIIELLFSNKEWKRPETKQLERIIELLTEIKANGRRRT